MSGKRILLVDDDDLLCDMLATLIELEGHSAHISYNGADGLAALQAEAFDLVLLDLVMPEMDGIRFLRTLPQVVADPPPVVVLSASLTNDLLDTARGMNVSGLVRKPITAEQLREVIQTTTGGS